MGFSHRIFGANSPFRAMDSGSEFFTSRDRNGAAHSRIAHEVEGATACLARVLEGVARRGSTSHSIRVGQLERSSAAFPRPQTAG